MHLKWTILKKYIKLFLNFFLLVNICIFIVYLTSVMFWCLVYYYYYYLSVTKILKQIKKVIYIYIDYLFYHLYILYVCMCVYIYVCDPGPQNQS